MTGHTTRRGFLRATSASAAAGALSLAGCGGGTIESALTPTRFIGFGDGFSDLGQGGASRFTVNVSDGSVTNWTQQVASTYGLKLTSVRDGGLSYAQGNARITKTPDAAGGAAPSIKQQIDSFLASNSFAATDVVVINGGISDIVVETMAVIRGTQNSTQALANVASAGVDLAAQIQRLVTAGAKYVLLSGVFNLSKTPWAKANSAQTTLLSDASAKFNEQLEVNIVNLGRNVLYVDAAYYFNLLYSTPATYSLVDSSTVVCSSVDTTDSIGIGANMVSSKLCTTATITNGLTYSKYMHADSIYFTPTAHAQFGNYAYGRLRERW